MSLLSAPCRPMRYVGFLFTCQEANTSTTAVHPSRRQLRRINSSPFLKRLTCLQQPSIQAGMCTAQHDTQQLFATAFSWVVCLDVIHQVVAGVLGALLDQHAQAISQDRHHCVVQVCPAQHPEALLSPRQALNTKLFNCTQYLLVSAASATTTSK